MALDPNLTGLRGGATLTTGGDIASVRRASAVAARLRDGTKASGLSFPLTPFASGDEVNLDAFRSHVRRQLAARPGALFPCCGTGELYSLAEPEYGELVRAAAEESAGQVPVVAGIGYGWAQAARFARIAEESPYAGRELRQVRMAQLDMTARQVRHSAEANSAESRGDAETAARHASLTASADAAAGFYRERGDLDEQLEAARLEWAAGTAPMRLAAVQADSLLRRRHPQESLEPLRSAEPEPLPDELPGPTNEASRQHAGLVAESLAAFRAEIASRARGPGAARGSGIRTGRPSLARRPAGASRRDPATTKAGYARAQQAPRATA